METFIEAMQPQIRDGGDVSTTSGGDGGSGRARGHRGRYGGRGTYRGGGGGGGSSHGRNNREFTTDMNYEQSSSSSRGNRTGFGGGGGGGRHQGNRGGNRRGGYYGGRRPGENLFGHRGPHVMENGQYDIPLARSLVINDEQNVFLGMLRNDGSQHHHHQSSSSMNNNGVSDEVEERQSNLIPIQSSRQSAINTKSIGRKICPVCLMDSPSITNALINAITTCEHVYCYECALRLMFISNKEDCPICRQKISRIVLTRATPEDVKQYNQTLVEIHPDTDLQLPSSSSSKSKSIDGDSGDAVMLRKVSPKPVYIKHFAKTLYWDCSNDNAAAVTGGGGGGPIDNNYEIGPSSSIRTLIEHLLWFRCPLCVEQCKKRNQATRNRQQQAALAAAATAAASVTTTATTQQQQQQQPEIQNELAQLTLGESQQPQVQAQQLEPYTYRMLGKTREAFAIISQHLDRRHNRVLCELCYFNLELFTSEYSIFSKAHYREHQLFGSMVADVWVAHRICVLCTTKPYFFNNESLSAHCKEHHISCYVCTTEIFFIDIDALREHLRDKHICCPICGVTTTDNLVAFATVLDLKCHVTREHPNAQVDYDAILHRITMLDTVPSINNRSTRGSGGGGGNGRNGRHDGGGGDLRLELTGGPEMLLQTATGGGPGPNMSRREAFDQIDTLLRTRFTSEHGGGTAAIPVAFNAKTNPESYLTNFPTISSAIQYESNAGGNSGGSSENNEIGGGKNVQVFPTKYRSIGKIDTQNYEQEFPGLSSDAPGGRPGGSGSSLVKSAKKAKPNTLSARAAVVSDKPATAISKVSKKKLAPTSSLSTSSAAGANSSIAKYVQKYDPNSFITSRYVDANDDDDDNDGRRGGGGRGRSHLYTDMGTTPMDGTTYAPKPKSVLLVDALPSSSSSSTQTTSIAESSSWSNNNQQQPDFPALAPTSSSKHGKSSLLAISSASLKNKNKPSPSSSSGVTNWSKTASSSSAASKIKSNSAAAGGSTSSNGGGGGGSGSGIGKSTKANRKDDNTTSTMTPLNVMSSESFPTLGGSGSGSGGVSGLGGVNNNTGDSSSKPGANVHVVGAWGTAVPVVKSSKKRGKNSKKRQEEPEQEWYRPPPLPPPPPGATSGDAFAIIANNGNTSNGGGVGGGNYGSYQTHMTTNRRNEELRYKIRSNFKLILQSNIVADNEHDREQKLDDAIHQRYNSYKKLTQSLRRGTIPIGDYFTEIRPLLDGDKGDNSTTPPSSFFDTIILEMITLTPNIELQHQLLYHLTVIEGRKLSTREQLWQCDTCGQLCMPSDRVEHQRNHQKIGATNKK